MTEIEQKMLDHLQIRANELEPDKDKADLAEMAYVNSELALALVELMEV